MVIQPHLSFIAKRSSRCKIHTKKEIKQLVAQQAPGFSQDKTIHEPLPNLINFSITKIGNSSAITSYFHKSRLQITIRKMNENYHNGVEKFVSPMQMHDKTKENVKISSKSNTIIPTLTDHILLTLCSVYVVFSFFYLYFLLSPDNPR